MEFVTGVTAAVYRYNPAIIAQAFASLDVLYSGRIGLGVGTGFLVGKRLIVQY
jgi:coenzyme F420-dependent glucose-6-phosphate dehydrogenase